MTGRWELTCTTLNHREVQRTAHGSTVAQSKPHDDLPQQASLYDRGSPSPRPRDVGEAAGAVTRGDIRLPQEQGSEDGRKGGLTADVDGAGRRVGRSAALAALATAIVGKGAAPWLFFGAAVAAGFSWILD